MSTNGEQEPSPLHRAAICNDVDALQVVIQQLLEQNDSGALENAITELKEPEGQNALFAACYYGYAAMTNILIDYGAALEV